MSDSGPSEFRCTQAGCSKTFTRKDHLVRHGANHTQASYHCPTCKRPFKRLDLLQRHEKRNVCYESKKRRRTSEASASEDYSPPIHRVSSPSPNAAPNYTLPNTSLLEQMTILNPVPDLMGTNNNTDWGFGLWPPDPWESLLHDTLAPPFNEPVIQMDMPWNILTPRLQESAERGGVSVASTALVARLQIAFPEFDISLPYLIEALQAYWTHISPSFPFIHCGTFSTDTASTELIAMMAITGATHIIPRRSFRTTVQQIRGSLVQNCGLDMPLSTLQAFTLCHVHDTWYGNAETLFVAQCMWPVMVAHSRKKGIGVVGRPENEVEEEQAWAAWAKDEERRRAAFSVLLIDTQLSAFWNQHPSRQLSIFAHNITLPCPRNQWEAMTASDWFRVREPPIPASAISRKPRSGYLPGLHPEFQVSVVSEGYSSSILSALAAEDRLPFRVDAENSLGVEMILIGLMAIAWDCRTRGGMGIRFREGTKHWRSIVLNAVINLRRAWEETIPPHVLGVEVRDMRDTFAISIISVLSDIPMLQVAAGSISVCGASIGPRQYADAKRRLRLWSKTEDAWTCLWQSARYLKQALHADWGIYSHWAAFLTTLVCWGYTWSSSTIDRLQAPTDNPREAAGILLDAIVHSVIRPEAFDMGISDLVSVVAEKLSLGEEVEREAAGLLWGLIGSGKARRGSEWRG